MSKRLNLLIRQLLGQIDANNRSELMIVLAIAKMDLLSS